MNGEAAWLLAALLIAHYLGDFTPLASRRMQEAKTNGGPLRVIAGHAGVHAVLVALAAATLMRPTPALVGAATALEFVTHFGIDAVRARMTARIPALRDPTAGTFWYVLGADQLAHGLVLVGVAVLVAG